MQQDKEKEVSKREEFLQKYKNIALEIPKNYYENDGLDLSPKITECYDIGRLVYDSKSKETNKFIEDNTCPICLNLIRDTCQCQFGCSGLFGYNCIIHNAISCCPYCRKEFEEDKDLYRNKLITDINQMHPIKIKCIYHEQGCKEELKYHHQIIQNHEERCTYQPVNCPQNVWGCNWKGKSSDLQQHRSKCLFNQFQCKFCHEQKENDTIYIQKDLENHFQNCKNKQISEVISQIDQTVKQIQEKENLSNGNKKISNNKKNLEDSTKSAGGVSECGKKVEISIDLLEEIQNLLEYQKNTIQFLNEKSEELIKYAQSLEKNADKARDKGFLLQDFNRGILNFNSLEKLKQNLNVIDKKFIKGIRWNENNLQCYQFSFKSKSDFTDTIDYIKKLAEEGEKYSQYSLARLYIFGDKNIQRNVELSLHWVNKSIEQNCAEGKYLLGRIQHNSADRQEQDFEKLLDLVNSASHLGNPEAKNFLGFVYGKGEGMVQNQKKALKFYKRAAQQGNFAALLNLGSYYEGGYGGLEKNQEKSFKYFEKSAKKGYVNAMIKVVQLLKAGAGVQQDEMQAARWEEKIEYHQINYTHSIQWQQQRQQDNNNDDQQQDSNDNDN